MNEFNEEDQNVMTTNQTNQNLEQLEVLLENLLQQKMTLAEEKRYTEAEEIKLQIEKTKKKLIRKKKEFLNVQHTNEMKQLEEKYTQEIKEFNEEWDNKLREFQENAKVQENNLNEKHQKEMQELHQTIETNNSKQTVKFSAQHIQLCQAEEKLVKQDKFKEAQVIANKRAALEKVEIEKFNKERLQKQKLKIETLEKKQENEVLTLKKKLEVEFNVLKNQRISEYDTLIYKYKNRKLGLELQQKQEKLLNENDNLNRQKTTADSIRTLHKPTSKHFYGTKSTTNTQIPRSIKASNVFKTQNHQEEENQEEHVEEVEK